MRFLTSGPSYLLCDSTNGCLVDNQEDLGKLLVDKNGEELSEIIRNKISELPHFLDQAILSVIEQMAAHASNNVKRVVIKP